MRIIIVGCGKIGASILANLAAEGHDVIGVDSNRSVIDELSNLYDVMCVCGNGADSDILTEVDASKADLFVAVTGSDEMNMLSCFLARKMGATYTIARIRTPEYNDKSISFLRRNLELSDSINPEYAVAHEIFNILKFPSAVNIETFSARNFEMIELILKDDSPLNGLRLMDIRKKYSAKFLVCAVQRGEEAFIPGGSFVLRGGDKIGVTANRAELHKLLKELGILQKKARNVIILGGSTTSFYLAKMLIAAGNSVKIIEKHREKCIHFAAELPDAVIINGDGAQQELLLEEGIDSADAFVSLTDMDEENIIISCFAKAQKVPTVITKINRSELAAMAQRLGLECVVSPQKTVGNIVTGYARALQNSIGSSVETLYKLMDGNVEVLEFSVGQDFEYINISLKEMKIKKNVLVAGIIRGRVPIIPSGDDVIMPGDKVIVLASDTRLQNLSDMIA
ncbi:MAG: Trk system potassium transporter TrkA [Ruminococcaceae bacterium]|nr:Trk system potassium transporter TrkA [Oscillospiraceae bacterium]